MYRILFVLFFPFCMVASEEALDDGWNIVGDGSPVVTHYPDNGYEGCMICSRGVLTKNELKLEWIARKAALVAIVQTNLMTQHVYMNAYNPPANLTDILSNDYDQCKNLAAWCSQFKDQKVLGKRLFVFMPGSIPSKKGEWCTRMDWRAKNWTDTLSRVLEVKEAVVFPYAISSYESEKVSRDGIDHVLVQTSTDGTTIRCQQSKDLSTQDRWTQKINFLEDTPTT